MSISEPIPTSQELVDLASRDPVKLITNLPRWKAYSKTSERWLCCVFISLRLLGRGEELREEISRNLVQVSEAPSLAFEVALFHWQYRQLGKATSWIAECILQWPEVDHFKSLLVELIIGESKHDLSFDTKVTNIEDLTDPGARGILHSIDGNHDAAAKCLLESLDQNLIRDYECLLAAWAVLFPLLDLPYLESVHAGNNYCPELYLVCAILAYRAEIEIYEKLLDKVIPGGLNAKCLMIAISYFGDRISYEHIRPFIFCYVVSADAKTYGLSRCMGYAKNAQDQMLVSSLSAHHLYSDRA